MLLLIIMSAPHKSVYRSLAHAGLPDDIVNVITQAMSATEILRLYRNEPVRLDEVIATFPYSDKFFTDLYFFSNETVMWMWDPYIERHWDTYRERWLNMVEYQISNRFISLDDPYPATERNTYQLLTGTQITPQGEVWGVMHPIQWFSEKKSIAYSIVKTT